MKVEFYGLLPAGADLFPGDHLDATGRLAELFGFTGLAHLTVSEGKAYQGENERPALVAAGRCNGGRPGTLHQPTRRGRTLRVRITIRPEVASSGCHPTGVAEVRSSGSRLGFGT